MTDNINRAELDVLIRMFKDRAEAHAKLARDASYRTHAAQRHAGNAAAYEDVLQVLDFWKRGTSWIGVDKQRAINLAQSEKWSVS